MFVNPYILHLNYLLLTHKTDKTQPTTQDPRPLIMSSRQNNHAAGGAGGGAAAPSRPRREAAAAGEAARRATDARNERLDRRLERDMGRSSDRVTQSGTPRQEYYGRR